jgi:hypothetical protein
MVTDIYIAKVKSEEFDYDLKGNWNGYFPENISELEWCSSLYWDILREEKSKQVDWGCWVLKLSKKDLTAYLNNEKYAEYKSVVNLIKFAETLDNDVEYLLVAREVC